MDPAYGRTLRFIFHVSTALPILIVWVLGLFCAVSVIIIIIMIMQSKGADFQEGPTLTMLGAYQRQRQTNTMNQGAGPGVKFTGAVDG